MNKSGRILVFCVLFCLVILPSSASEDERQQMLLLELADSLLREEKLVSAFTLYHEFLELYPQSPLRLRALRSMAEIYEKRQDLAHAAKLHRKLFEEIGLSESGLLHRLEEARLLMRMGYESQAKVVLEEIIFLAPYSEAAAEARNRLLLFRVLPHTE